MSRIVMADDGIVFDGLTLEQKPLGGAETAFVELANALAAHGHEVIACTRCDAPLSHRGVTWQPLSQGIPDSADLYIANRGDKLLKACRQARATIFWIHNPAQYLLKWRYQWKLAWRRPTIVFSGPSHAGTYPAWGFDGGRESVPLGLGELFLHAPLRTEAPPPRAVFTSNPMRSLDWILDLWESRIHPAVPQAELHVFAGQATYGSLGASKAAKMTPVLDRAAALQEQGIGVRLRGPVEKAVLADELLSARALLYRGDIGETFCFAAAEAQAMGVPAVVEDIACMSERIRQGQTGWAVTGAEAFADKAIRILTDDTCWLDMHRACLDSQRSWTWDLFAAEFERIGQLPSA